MIGRISRINRSIIPSRYKRPSSYTCQNFRKASVCVILFVFYQTILIISYKLSVHYHPFWMSRTLGRIIAVSSAHLLRVTEVGNQPTFLGINIVINHISFYRFCGIFNYIFLYNATFILWLWLLTCIRLFLYIHIIPNNGKIHIVFL